MKSKTPTIDRVRYESFGGIISCLDPPFLAWVDRSFMKNIGYNHSSIWDNKNNGYLSAPTEVHFAVTNTCSQGCQGCYMSSGSDNGNDLSLVKIKNILLKFREMGVFHVALGGGEAFERTDFGEIVSWCRHIGLVPNLTTNGQNIGEKELNICKQLGQVNISMDGLDDVYSVNGRQGSFGKADSAIQRLRLSDIPVGINCTVSKKNFSHLKDIIAYAAKRGLNEIEFLKYKPSGRGRTAYNEFALSQDMIRNIYPLLMKYGDLYSVEVKIDCSFIPALVYHHPPKDELEKLAVTGCDGGNLLLGVKSNGMFSACSFVENDEDVNKINDLWHSSPHLRYFRNWTSTAPEPCRSCDYLMICRGGCRAVALHLTGGFENPDPECPFVYDYYLEKRSDER